MRFNQFKLLEINSDLLEGAVPLLEKGSEELPV